GARRPVGASALRSHGRARRVPASRGVLELAELHALHQDPADRRCIRARKHRREQPARSAGVADAQRDAPRLLPGRRRLDGAVPESACSTGDAMNLVLDFLERHRARLKLEQYRVPERLTCVMLTPRFRASRHVVFLVLPARKPYPVLVAKVPRLGERSQSLTREATAIETIQKMR